ncbi:ESX secretion-associated protein EspG [Mycolicibacterium smegmatis]|uniref:ESX secretion-associated protein EspG n=1 Tax=Mycolicibacterium smegmatis TaxID=1772 RepID=UPI0013034325|nr:ESX secretion-associated protein EspG [Mycolicibacterium smegmatis]
MERWRLTTDEVLALGRALGIHDLPQTLVGRSRHQTMDDRDDALDRATDEMVARGLIVDGVVDPNVAAAVNTMWQPHREIAMRRVTPHGTAYVSVLRNGATRIRVRRINENVLLHRVNSADILNGAVKALMDDLPAARPADIEPTGAPQPELAESLSGTHDARALSDRIRALGSSPRAAVLLGTALAERQAFAEIVYYRLVSDEGRVTRYPSAVAVFYTARGRIVSTPSISPAGELWTTLRPGTDTAVGQAVRQLVALSGEGWEENHIDYDT